MEVHQVHWSSKPTSFYKCLAHANRANERATRKKQAATRLANAGEQLRRAAKDLKLAAGELEAVRSRLARCIAAGDEAGAAEAAEAEPAHNAKVHALRQRAATAKGEYQTLQAAARGALPPKATGPCTHDTMAAMAAAARAPKPAPPAMVDSRVANRKALEASPELRRLKSKVVAWAKSFTAAESARQEAQVAAQKAQHVADSWCKALPPPADPNDFAERAAVRARNLQERLQAAHRARQQELQERDEQAVVTASRVAATVEQQQRAAAVAAGAYVPGSYYQLCSAPSSAFNLDGVGNDLTLAAPTDAQSSDLEEKEEETKATVPSSPEMAPAAESATLGTERTRLHPAETPTTPLAPPSPAPGAATASETSSAVDVASPEGTTATKEHVAPKHTFTDGVSKKSMRRLPVAENAALRLAATSRLSQEGPHARRAWLPSGFRCKGVNCAPVSDAGDTGSWSADYDEGEGKRRGDAARSGEKDGWAVGARPRVPSSAVVRYFSLPPPLLPLNQDESAPAPHSTWHRRRHSEAQGASGGTKGEAASTTATTLARPAAFTNERISTGRSHRPHKHASSSQSGPKLKATKSTVGGLVRSLAEDLFVAGDRNGDGVLNPEELRNAFTVLGTGPDGRATKIFQRLGVSNLASIQTVLHAEAVFEGLGYGRGHTGGDENDAPRTSNTASRDSRAAGPSPSWEHGPFVTEPECAAYLAFAAHSLRHEAQCEAAAATTKASATARGAVTAAVAAAAVATTTATITDDVEAPSQEGCRDINKPGHGGGGVGGGDASFAAPTPPRRSAPSVPPTSVTPASKPKSVGFAEPSPEPLSTPPEGSLASEAQDVAPSSPHVASPSPSDPPTDSEQVVRTSSVNTTLSPDAPPSSSTTQWHDFYANEVDL